MPKTYITKTELVLLLLAGLMAAFSFVRFAHGQEPHFVRTDGLLAAQACVHEATWGGARSGDCGGIIQVVETRRRPGETFSSALRRTMPRFARGATDRAWVSELPYGPLTRDPVRWPFRVPAAHYSDAWRAVLHRVSEYMHGLEPMPCTPAPSAWFGRRTDGNVLAARLDSGRWREADCGETANAFLYAIDVD